MGTTRLGRASTVLLLTCTLVAAGAGLTLAAKGDKKPDKADKGDGGTPAATLIATVDGDRFKMAQAKMADKLTIVQDASGDQVMADGTAATAADGWTDIASVHLAPVKLQKKLLTQMDDDYPRGAVGAFYGADADWAKLDKAVYVAVELADRRPTGTVQQVEVGLDGDAAAPLEAGAASDTRAGLERFSLSGIFNNGAEASGTTDVSGRRPGEAIDYYNTESRVFGFYDSRQRTYHLIMPLPADARSVAVALRTMTSAGEVIDRLELPGGGTLIPLDDPGLGWDPAEGSAPLACRSLETFGSATDAPGLAEGMTRIRYSAGADLELAPADADAVLAALDAAGSSVPMTLSPVGTDGASGEPQAVDAAVSRAPGLAAFTLTMDVPAGSWTIEAADPAALLTPAGERLVDLGSLTGRAGVRTGTGLDGFVAGEPACARWDLGAEACELTPADGLALLVGVDASAIEQRVLHRPDGSAWCVGTATASGEVQYIARFGTSFLTSEDLADLASTTDCEASPQDVGAESIVIDCGAQGFERHLFRVVPRSIAARDPDGGLLLSVDMLVDGGKPLGQRYDADFATALFGDLVDTVAASALPALAGQASDTPSETTEEPAAPGE